MFLFLPYEFIKAIKSRPNLLDSDPPDNNGELTVEQYLDQSDYLGFKSIPEGVRTRRLAESQDEYQNLDIIDAPFTMPDGRQVNQMTCYLHISEDQRKRIYEGSTLSVKILGKVFQPIMVKLEEVPESEE